MHLIVVRYLQELPENYALATSLAAALQSDELFGICPRHLPHLNKLRIQCEEDICATSRDFTFETLCSHVLHMGYECVSHDFTLPDAFDEWVSKHCFQTGKPCSKT